MNFLSNHVILIKILLEGTQYIKEEGVQSFMGLTIRHSWWESGRSS